MAELKKSYIKRFVYSEGSKMGVLWLDSLNEFIRMESMYLWRISLYTYPNNLHLLLTVDYSFL